VQENVVKNTRNVTVLYTKGDLDCWLDDVRGARDQQRSYAECCPKPVAMATDMRWCDCGLRDWLMDDEARPWMVTCKSRILSLLCIVVLLPFINRLTEFRKSCRFNADKP